jgi:c(7)-type cytochrome triheme protein
MGRQFRRSGIAARGKMTLGVRHKVLRALLALSCTGAGAAEPVRNLAFLRAAPQTETSEEPAPRARAAPDTPAREVLGKSDYYDPRNPDLGYLQSYDEAVANLPMDDNGFPDWMRALRQSKIQPRMGLKPDASMNVLDLDVIMKNTREMPFVRFPHLSHTLWLDCSNCHPAPFEPVAGSTQVTMTDIFRGKYCGMCHDRVAFITFFSCQRCHSVAQRGGVALPK